MQIQSAGLVTIHTEVDEKEFLYPNLAYCRFLKSWFKYAMKRADFAEEFHVRQREIGKALKMDYEDKPGVAIHLRDIVATMIVSKNITNEGVHADRNEILPLIYKDIQGKLEGESGSHLWLNSRHPFKCGVLIKNWESLGDGPI